MTSAFGLAAAPLIWCGRLASPVAAFAASLRSRGRSEPRKAPARRRGVFFAKGMRDQEKLGARPNLLSQRFLRIPIHVVRACESSLTITSQEDTVCRHAQPRRGICAASATLGDARPRPCSGSRPPRRRRQRCRRRRGRGSKRPEPFIRAADYSGLEIAPGPQIGTAQITAMLHNPPIHVSKRWSAHA